MRREKFSRRLLNFFENRTFFAKIFFLLLFLGIVFRLFELQIVEGEKYAEMARAQDTAVVEMPARRGEILVKNRDGDALVKMATNTTLDLVYVDPQSTPNKRLVADTLSKILFTEQKYQKCLADENFCPEGSVILENRKNENGDDLPPKIIFPDKKTAQKAFADEIFRKINREYFDFVVVARNVSDEKLDRIVRLATPGVEILRQKQIVFFDPTQFPRISEKIGGKKVFKTDPKFAREISKKVAAILEKNPDDILPKTALKKVRYVEIEKKIRPEISEKIREIKKVSRQKNQESSAEILRTKSKKTPVPDFFRGIVLTPEHLRYYPDGKIAAHLLGFVNHENRGQYGIEGKFDRLLAGKKGKIEMIKDVKKRGVSPNIIQKAIDGANVVLTIDRIVQKRVEEILDEAVKNFRADSGQIIVLEPKTGKIIAMANSPRFDPNNFADAFAVERTTPENSKEIFKTTPIFKKDEHGRLVRSTFEDFQNAWREKFNPEFYIYKNRLGPGAFINRAVQEAYEPGSVFKPLVMAAAIDAGEVLPSTTFHEDGPVMIGNFPIRTATGEYRGLQTMTNVLETSSNVGMVFVAFKLGKNVMFDAITKKFGFGDYTDVELDEEVPGKVLPKKDWSDALLATSSFGQGLTATPIQMARAWGALANGGILMRPQIVSEIQYPDGKIEKRKPTEIRRAISADTATTITAMLVSSVENGVAHPAKIPGYRVAGKTGTSQIAGPDGKYETGEGAFITSFAGYAPAENPRFLVLVKFDRPRLGVENTWGSTTAAPIFREVMKFLLDYAGVPPSQ